MKSDRRLLRTYKRSVCANGTQAVRRKKPAVNGYFVFVSILAAFVALIALRLWLKASVEITRLDPKNAHKTIGAIGQHFPLRRWWRGR